MYRIYKALPEAFSIASFGCFYGSSIADQRRMTERHKIFFLACKNSMENFALASVCAGVSTKAQSEKECQTYGKIAFKLLKYKLKKIVKGVALISKIIEADANFTYL